MRSGFSLFLISGALAMASAATAAPPVVRGPGMPPIPPRVTPVVRPPSYSPTGGYVVPRFPKPEAAAALPSTIHVGPMAEVPAFRPPPPNADKATMLAASKEIMARQSVRMKNFLPTTGYKSLDEIATKTAQLSPTRATVVGMLKAEDKFEFAMRTPAGIRESISTRGFLTSHETRTSRGSQDVDARERVEASFLGVSREEYSAVPNAIRPKYGYLRPAKETGIKMADGAEQYGEDVFVFKRDALKEHVTVYPLDSVANSVLGWPVKPIPPATKEAQPTEWHQALVPWKDRMLLAPDLDVPAGTNELRFHNARAPEGFVTRPAAFSRYVEVQIWRPVGIEDVERFEFSAQPPTGAFLNALRTNHVKIFRLGDSSEWTGGAS